MKLSLDSVFSATAKSRKLHKRINETCCSGAKNSLWSVNMSSPVAWMVITMVSVFGLARGDSYFMYAGPVVGDGGSLNVDVARNTTQLLDQLLQGYDSRLRPGFGGAYTVSIFLPFNRGGGVYLWSGFGEG